MAAHARLKNEFTGDEKNHNLMAWLICAQQILKSACGSAQFHQSSLGALWVAKEPKRHHVDSEDSDQTANLSAHKIL